LSSGRPKSDRLLVVSCQAPCLAAQAIRYVEPSSLSMFDASSRTIQYPSMSTQQDRDRLLSLPPPQRTNAILSEQFASRFLGYWSFGEPKQAGIEWGDTLLVFDDVCFIVEAKTRNKPGGAPTTWIRSAIAGAVEQINKKADAFASGQVNTLRNKWRGQFKWGDLGIEHYYGIVVLMHTSDPYVASDLAPDAMASARYPTSVVSLHDLLELLRFINTAPDLINYFEMRHFISREYEIRVHEEQAVFNLYSTDWAKLTRRYLKPDWPEDQIRRHESELQSMRHAILDPASAPAESIEALHHSLLIDFALRVLIKKADPDATGMRVGSDEHRFYISCIEHFVELSRLRRAVYGRAWHETATKVLASGTEEWTECTSPSRRRAYLLVADPSDEPLQGQLALRVRDKLLDLVATTGTDSGVAVVGAAGALVSAFDYFTSEPGESALPDQVTFSVVGVSAKREFGST
jgi:hypothetical protein